MKNKSHTLQAVPDISYPPGCPPLIEGQGNNETIRRLKLLADALRNVDSDVEKNYAALASFLTQPLFMQHTNRQIRVLTACCLADLLRIYAPEIPFDDHQLLKTVLQFLMRSMRGCENMSDLVHQRALYLVDNLSVVKSMSLILELPEEDAHVLMVMLIKTCVSCLTQPTINTTLINTMLEMVLPILQDAENLPAIVFDAIFVNILEPLKSQNRQAYHLCKEILLRGQLTLETHLQMYFSSAIVGGKPIGGELAAVQIYPVLVELYNILPEFTANILPQLEDKITIEDTRERSSVIRHLWTLFTAKGCNLAEELPNLFHTLLNRFMDSDKDIRLRCVDAGKELLLNHPSLRGQVSHHLAKRALDSDEAVRLQVINVITSAAGNDLAAVNEQLLMCVKGRALDKKFSVRKAALRSLACLYRDVCLVQTTVDSDRQSLSWIKDLVLHSYRKGLLDDMILCEKLLCNCLVPYKQQTSRRTQLLIDLFVTIDDLSLTSFVRLFKEQTQLREILLKLVQLAGSKIQDESLRNKLIKQFSEKLSSETQNTDATKFYELLKKDERFRTLVGNVCECKSTRIQTDSMVSELMLRTGSKGCAASVQNTCKVVLERCSPLLVDEQAVHMILHVLDSWVNGEINVPYTNINKPQAIQRLLTLTLELARAYSRMFHGEQTVAYLCNLLDSENTQARQYVCRIVCLIKDLGPENTRLCELVVAMVRSGSRSNSRAEAKWAIRAIANLFPNDYSTKFKSLFQELEDNVTLSCEECVTSLESLGAMMRIGEGDKKSALGNEMKRIMALLAVKQIILDTTDHESQPSSSGSTLSTKCRNKIAAIRFMARYLIGVKTDDDNLATNSIKLLTTLVRNHGDLKKSNNIPSAEMAQLRLAAGSALLKMAKSCAIFGSMINGRALCILAMLIHDSEEIVRDKFEHKLSISLLVPKMPLRFMSLFSLVPLLPQSTHPENMQKLNAFTKLARSHLESSINIRRQWMIQWAQCQERPWFYCPEYSVQHTVYLLGELCLVQGLYNDDGLLKLKQCLWFVLEPIINTKYANSAGNVQLVYKLLQEIKQMQGNLGGNARLAQKLWAVCDLGILLLTHRAPALSLQTVPISCNLDLTLFSPAKEFIDKRNTHVYLPENIVDSEKKHQHIKTNKNKRNGNLNATSSTVNARINRSESMQPSINDLSSMDSDTEISNINHKLPRKRKVTQTRTNGIDKSSSPNFHSGDSDSEPLQFLNTPNIQPMTSTPNMAAVVSKRQTVVKRAKTMGSSVDNSPTKTKCKGSTPASSHSFNGGTPRSTRSTGSANISPTNSHKYKPVSSPKTTNTVALGKMVICESPKKASTNSKPASQNWTSSKLASQKSTSSESGPETQSPIKVESVVPASPRMRPRRLRQKPAQAK